MRLQEVADVAVQIVGYGFSCTESRNKVRSTSK